MGCLYVFTSSLKFAISVPSGMTGRYWNTDIASRIQCIFRELQFREFVIDPAGAFIPIFMLFLLLFYRIIIQRIGQQAPDNIGVGASYDIHLLFVKFHTIYSRLEDFSPQGDAPSKPATFLYIRSPKASVMLLAIKLSFFNPIINRELCKNLFSYFIFKLSAIKHNPIITHTLNEAGCKIQINIKTSLFLREQAGSVLLSILLRRSYV